MEMLRDSDSSDEEDDDDNKYDCVFSDDVTDGDEIVMFELRRHHRLWGGSYMPLALKQCSMYVT